MQSKTLPTGWHLSSSFFCLLQSPSPSLFALQHISSHRIEVGSAVCWLSCLRAVKVFRIIISSVHTASQQLEKLNLQFTAYEIKLCICSHTQRQQLFFFWLQVLVDSIALCQSTSLKSSMEKLSLLCRKAPAYRRTRGKSLWVEQAYIQL